MMGFMVLLTFRPMIIDRSSVLLKPIIRNPQGGGVVFASTVFEPSCDTQDGVARDCKLPELQRFDLILQHGGVHDLCWNQVQLFCCAYLSWHIQLKTEAGEYAKLKFEGLISIYVNLFSPFIYFPFYIFLFFPLTNLFFRKKIFE